MENLNFISIAKLLKSKTISPEMARDLFDQLKNQPDKSQTDSKPDVTNKTSSQIAVVGMSGQFPDAENVNDFWENLVSGHDAIRELPSAYIQHFKGTLRESSKNNNYPWGGILKDRDCFDPMFFNIAPKEAYSMNPHQRLVMQESWKALEDAGYNPLQLATRKVGVFIGAEPTGYVHESFTGYSDAIIASRLSYYLDLKGPALVVNTGCSSSSVAIHMACHSLRNGESTMTLAGGVFAMLDQNILTRLSEIGMLSPTGHCHAFNESADGTVLSEGVGIVVLKRLEDAIQDGDTIYGIIAASGINQDGTSNGITAPSGTAQEELLTDIYNTYNINPEDITFVEAHGTGTILGDSVEANALIRSFKQFTSKNNYCHIGSAKSFIGHTAAAAGVIGLIKVLLSMKHKVIPGLLHFNKLNSIIDFRDSAFQINPESIEWKSENGKPLTAALNSFGHSGTNVHLVIREYCDLVKTPTATVDSGEVLIPVSARTKENLNTYINQLIHFLRCETLKENSTVYPRELQHSLEGRLTERLSFIMGIQKQDIEPSGLFEEYGVDTNQKIQLIKYIQEEIHATLHSGELLACESIQSLINCLLKNTNDHSQFPPKGKIEENYNRPGHATKKINLKELAYTMQTGRSAMQERIIFLVSNTGELLSSLEKFQQAIPDPTHSWRGSQGKTKGIVDALTQDADIQGTFKKWFSQNKLEKLAQLWSQGVDVDWGQMYSPRKPARISLPTYPFSREHYWKPGNQLDSIGAISIGSEKIHPLLHRNISDFSEQKFSSIFHGEEFFFAHHIVKGKRVMPGVASLEWTRIAIEQSLGTGISQDSVLHLYNIGWVRPIVVEYEPREVFLKLTPQNDSLAYSIYSLDNEKESQIHTQGYANIKKATFTAARNLQDLKSSCNLAHYNAEQFYVAFKAVGVDLGAALQGVSNVYVGSHEVLAELSLPEILTSTEDEFFLHPSLLDSSVQAFIGLVIGPDFVRPAIPFALDELIILKKFTSKMFAHVRSIGGSLEKDKMMRLDIDVYDLDGVVCAQMKGMTVRLLENEIETSQQTQTLLFTPSMDETSGKAQSSGTGYSEHHLLLPEASENTLSSIREYFPESRVEGLRSSSENIGDRFSEHASFLFEYVKGIITRKPKKNLLIQVVIPSTPDGEIINGLRALLQTATIENPHVHYQIIELKEHTSEAGLVNALKENRAAIPNQKSSYKQREYYQEGWRKKSPGKIEIPWKDNGVYLITGGIGGLGRIFAREIAQKVKHPVLVLLGRSKPNGDSQQLLSELKNSGARANYFSCDIGDLHTLTDLIQNIQSEIGTINGIIHSAGVVQDNYILKKTVEEFKQILSPKVNGLVNLDEASKSYLLDFFITFSSTAGAFGNAGQADYAAGNAFMDNFMIRRDMLVKSGERKGRSLSINWPLWKDGGMSVDKETLKTIYHTMGMKPMTTAQGIQAFYQGYALQSPRCMILAGSEAKIERFIENASQGQTTHYNNVVALESNDELNIQSTTHSPNDNELEKEALNFFRHLISSAIQLPLHNVDVDTPFEKYGIDSILVIQLNNQLEQKFGPLSKTLFFEYRNIRELTQHFTSSSHGEALQKLIAPGIKVPIPIQRETSAKTKEINIAFPNRRLSPSIAEPAKKSTEEPEADIAIIGLSGKFPGAKNITEFWENISKGKDSIREVPKERWDIDRYFDARKNTPGKVYFRWGGFIDDVDKFDPLFFNISPRDAALIDPQERLFLECAYHTLEDAGYLNDLKQGSDELRSMGVFVGVMFNEYQLLGVGKAMNESVWGIPSSIANRVSYFFNLNGPSMTVDTMCSSSLTSIHLACESIKRGECTTALAGGVNISIHPNKYLFLSNNKFASSKGKCESFGLGGDGYVPGEGVGAILLKPRKLAECDGDFIYGVIKSTAINHGGKTNGYTVPNPGSHAKVISKAIQQAKINLRAISYLEAHGTGTSLGDPIEIDGLKKVFEQFTQDKQFCSIGSVKSNIGHCESAAGIAGIAKVLLQFKHRQLAPSLHSKTLNPYIDFSNSPFTVQQKLEDWERPVLTVNGTEHEYRRVAGVSSFGAGGSNAHIILEEYDVPVNEPIHDTGIEPAVIILSAKNYEQLRAQAEQLLKAIHTGAFTENDLRAIAYTLQVYREHMDERLGFIVSSLSDLKVNMHQFLQGNEKASQFYQAKSGIGNETIFSPEKYPEDSLQTLIHNRDYDTLLQYWLRGGNFNWKKFYLETKPQKLNFPGYCFAKDKYWVESSDKSVDGSKQKRIIHPLLHENTSTLSGQRFTTTFTGDEFFIAGHVVNGVPIISGVAFLEMARAAIVKASDKKDKNACLVFQRHNWYRPVSVESNSVSVTIGLQTDISGKISYSIYMGCEPGSPCCQGSAIWRFQAPFADYDLSYLKSLCSGEMLNAEKCYPILEKMGVRYGASQQALKFIQTGNGNVLAKIMLPDSVKATFQDYTLHPSLLDAVIQATVFIDPHNHTLQSTSLKPYIPVSIEEMILSRECPSSLWAFIQQQPENSHAGTLLTNIDILDENGMICFRITGLLSKATETNRLSRTTQSSATFTSELSGLITLLPSWNDIQLEVRTDFDFSKTALVIGTQDRHAKISGQFFANRIHLEFTADDEIDLLKEKILDASPFQQIVWIASGSFPDEVNSFTFVDYQKKGVLKLFKFVKALLQANYNSENLEWTFVTEQVQPINESETSNPAHSSLFGFIGSMAKEFPTWKTKMADVPLNEPWPSWEAILSVPFSEGQPFVYRNKQWYECQLLPVTLPEKQPNPSVYRVEGTYVVIGGAGGIGREWSEYLIKKYNAQLIWIGRREVDVEINAKLDNLGRLGKRPEYFSADASSLQSLQQAYQEIKKNHTIINGIVHAALVIHGRNLVSMELENFKQTLASKIDTSVVVSQVFSNDKPDFILFFSSTNSLIKAAGQSNYAAGSTFQDTYAHWLSLQLPSTVKVINWGYWANIGRVANADGFNNWLTRKGIESIEPQEGMHLLENFLLSPFKQIAVFKIANRSGLEGITPAEELVSVARNDAHFSLSLPQSVLPKKEYNDLMTSTTLQELNSMNALLVEILEAQLIESNLLSEKHNLNKRFNRWIHESFRILGYTELSKRDGVVEKTWATWEKQKSRWRTNSNLNAYINLVETTLRALPDILLGKKLATDVIFPQSSMQLTEGIYKNNILADYFNTQVATAVISFTQQRIKQDPSVKIRIIEFGAGTGGTSAGIFEALKPYSRYIETYCYTDVSKAFLMHAEKTFQPYYPYVNPVLFDLQKPFHLQNIELSSYDIAIAANVLHATKKISSTLRNLKPALKRNGLLILNEITKNSLFMHLTFGLLDGWWLYEDPAIRIPGCPGLTAQSWKYVLEQEGFYSMPSSDEELDGLDQQIIRAQSNGIIRQLKVTSEENSHIVKSIGQREKTYLTPNKSTQLPAVNATEDYVKETILKALENTLKVSRTQIDPDKQFADYGLDSILGVNFVQTINEKLEIDFDTTRLFDYVTVKKLTQYLISTYGSRILVQNDLPLTKNIDPPFDRALANNTTIHKVGLPVLIKPGESFSVEPIAIIGMSGRFAESESLNELWKNLAEGKDLIKKVSRWDLASYFEKENASQEYCNHGSFIDGIDCFDPLFFSISGNEATYMDPQQRLFLEESWRALEDAGYAGKAIEGKKCGVYVGHNSSDYYQLFQNQKDIPAQAMWGNAASIIPARIAYYLNLQGPAITIDSACSSSLVAIHLACQGLWSGETEMALAGGVFIQCTPSFYVSANRSGMLSPAGRCFTFDDRADGFVPGEGVGAVILKRLRDALQDGDHIYGVISGSGLNQDGTTNGITAPSANSQEALEKYVYEKFGINPENIQMVEAHGTGTKLGDPIEFNALSRSFRHFTNKKNYCAIGSIKSNLGHATAAAGIAGLFKILLALKNDQIPPSLHFEKGNKNINFDDSPFYVNNALKAWKRNSDRKRSAAISAFGFSGTNAHIIIEDAPVIERHFQTKPAYLIVLSARTKLQLKAQAANLQTFCKENPSTDCGDMSFTLVTGRKHNKHRLACLARNTTDLANQLQVWCNAQVPEESEFWYAEISTNQDTSSAYQPSQKKIREKLNFFADTKEYIATLIEMANHYITKHEIDFSSLFPGDHFRRISLPTYPFAKERYWVEIPSQSDQLTSGETVQSIDSFYEEFSSTLRTIPEPSANFTIDTLFDSGHETDLNFESFTLVPTWKNRTIERGKYFSLPQGKVLIVGGTTEQRNSLFGLFPLAEVLDIRSDESIDSLSAKLGRPSPYDHIIYVAQNNEWKDTADERLIEDQKSITLHLFRLLKAFIKIGYENDDLFCTIITTKAKSIHKIENANPLHAAIHGITGSLSKEFPYWKVRLIDLESDVDWPIHDILSLPPDEQGNPSVYRSGTWFSQMLKETILPQAQKSIIRKNGVYVIIGGAGGIGEVFSEYLIKTYQARIIWIGRRQKDERIEGRINRLTKFGIAPVYLSADAADKAALQQAYTIIRNQFGEINGIVHAAMILLDQSLVNMGEDKFYSGLANKADICVRIAQVFKEEALDFVLFFSSMISFTTAAGQSNYASGSLYKDAFAHELSREWTCPVKIINWGYWGDTGVVASEEYKTSMLNKGVGSIQPAEGMEIIERLLASSSINQAAFIKAKRPLPLHNIEYADTTNRHKIDLDEVLLDINTHYPPESLPVDNTLTSERINSELIQFIASLLKVDLANIEMSAEWSDLGFDPVTFTKLLAHINERFELELSTEMLTANQSVNRITQYLVKEIEKRNMSAITIFDVLSPLEETSGSKQQPEMPFYLDDVHSSIESTINNN